MRLTIQPPSGAKLAEIVQARLDLKPDQQDTIDEIIRQFVARRDGGDQQELSTDQLLNAVYMLVQGVNPLDHQELLDLLLKPLTGVDEPEGV